MLLPQLQHLNLDRNWSRKGDAVALPNSILQGLQQLTYLELAWCRVQDPDGTRHLQQLGLTRLRHLGLDCVDAQAIPASTLSGLQRLTCLKVTRLYGSCPMEPDALAGKPLLQHLVVVDSHTASTAGVAQLLSHLQHLQQLTYLDLSGSLRSEEASPPAAAYAALTASSKLRHLDISRNHLRAGVWQRVFPAGRQLPHLLTLKVGDIGSLSDPIAAPEGSSLVSCCPALQTLRMQHLQCSAELLAPLSGLSGLHELQLHPAGGSADGLEVLCRLTGLRRLDLLHCSGDPGLLLQLTELKQLTHLRCADGVRHHFRCMRMLRDRMRMLRGHMGTLSQVSPQLCCPTYWACVMLQPDICWLH